ncbi:hypothetical protein ACFWYW_46585 [Nonomuraea sp. NPDC059023]|uniref:hypothetical protein n=1 Tax=unclassified Nonomuraea TaxID=2593643 RepID=UPI00369EB9B2
MVNTSAPWLPLRARAAGVSTERTLVAGTPDYLLRPLQGWLEEASNGHSGLDLAEMVQLRLRRTDLYGNLHSTGAIVVAQGDDLLEAIDAALDIYNFVFDDEYYNAPTTQWWALMVHKLEMILNNAGSMWRLTDKANGLIERVDPTVTAAADSAVQAAPQSAGQLLRRAWDAAYGMNPDTGLAYSHAVKAVEAVVIPVTTPNDKQATLGKALSHLRNTAASWSLVIDDKNGDPAPIDAVIAMIALLWHGQRDRHAGPAMKPASLEAARTAVHGAATLVHWFSTGAVQKQP